MSDEELALCPEYLRRVLLTNGTSKCNKVHIAVGLQSRGIWLEYDWEPETVGGFKQQVRFRFEPDGKWIESECFDDVFQKMKESEKK